MMEWNFCQGHEFLMRWRQRLTVAEEQQYALLRRTRNLLVYFL
jgi:hypothetical protein